MIIHPFHLVLSTLAHWHGAGGEERDRCDVGLPARQAVPLVDRDPRFTKELRAILKAAGVEALRTPPRSPNLNAFAERFVRSIKEECLGRVIFFSERQLRTAVREYVEHYHRERNHQGLANRLIEPAAGEADATG